MRPTRSVFTWGSIVVSIAALLITQQQEWMQRLAGLDGAAQPYGTAREATLAGYLLGGVLQVVPHELGHLLAALALRLPVLGMAIGPFRFGARPLPGTAGHVSVDLSSVEERVPVRLTVLSLAGPAGGLIAAGVALLLARDAAFSAGVRLALASAAVTAVAAQLANLVPERISGTLPNDGAQALRWIARPAAELAQLRLGRELSALARSGDRLASPDSRIADLDRIRAALADPRPQVALLAAHALNAYQLASHPQRDGGPEISLDTYRQQRLDELPLVERYAARGDQPIELRAVLAARALEVAPEDAAVTAIVAVLPERGVAHPSGPAS